MTMRIDVGFYIADEWWEWHARHVWNVGIQYKVQCGHGDSSEWNVWYAWNADSSECMVCKRGARYTWLTANCTEIGVICGRALLTPLLTYIIIPAANADSTHS